MSSQDLRLPIKLLVTCGSGYVGLLLVSKLTREPNTTVFTLDKKPLGLRAHERVYRKLPMSELDTVIHLASIADQALCERIPHQAIRTNVLGTYLLLNYASAAKIPHIIYASSASVYGH